MSQNHSVFHIFLVLWNFNSVYCLDDLWTDGCSCDGGGDYSWFNSAIYCIYWGL